MFTSSLKAVIFSLSVVSLVSCAQTAPLPPPTVKDCGYLVFKGQSLDHTKEVRMCLFSKDKQNYLELQGNDLNGEGAVSITNPVTYSGWNHVTTDPDVTGDVISSANADVIISVSNGTEYGKPRAFYSFISTKNLSAGLAIDVDPETVELYTAFGKHTLMDFGVPYYLDDKFIKVENNIVAPERH